MVRATRLAAVAMMAATGLAVSGLAPADAHRGKGHSSGPTVIASGLDNPRGLAFSPDGALYVVEAGAGGDGPCFTGPEGGQVCFGLSGAVTKVGKWGQRRVLSGLPSYAEEGTGNTAIGPSDVDFKGSSKMYVTVGLGLDLPFSDTIPELADMGELIVAHLGKKHRHHHHWTAVSKVRTVADLAEFEAANNPTGDELNVNPNSVLVSRHGVIVSDAGANDLLKVGRDGDIEVLATFPNVKDVGGTLIDEVPTTVAKGPDGALYVGQLTGFPFPPGLANVYRVDRDGTVETFAAGFTNIISIAFDRRGNLYVLEISKNGLASPTDPATGALIRVNRDGTREEIMSTGLILPGGMVLRGDFAYVSNCGTCAGSGEVLRVPLR